MTVLTYASGTYDRTAQPRPSPVPRQLASATAALLTSSAELLVGATAGDFVDFGEIPSDARLSKGMTLYYDAVTGVMAFDLGIGRLDDVAKTLIDGNAACLISAQDIHLAGSSTLAAVDIADLPKPAWKLAGYAADPGGNLRIIGKVHTGTATAQGTVTVQGNVLTSE